MNPIIQEAWFRVEWVTDRHLALQGSLQPVCICILIPKAGVQFLILYKVQRIRKSKQNLNN